MSIYPAPINSRCPVKGCQWTNKVSTELQFIRHLEKKHPKEATEFERLKAEAEAEAAVDGDGSDDSDSVCSNDYEDNEFDAKAAYERLVEENKQIRAQGASLNKQMVEIMAQIHKLSLTTNGTNQAYLHYTPTKNKPFSPSPSPSPSPAYTAIPQTPQGFQHPPVASLGGMVKSPTAPKPGAVKLKDNGPIGEKFINIPVGKIKLAHDDEYTTIFKDRNEKFCYYSPVKETGEMKKRYCTQSQTTAQRMLPLSEDDMRALGYNKA